MADINAKNMNWFFGYETRSDSSMADINVINQKQLEKPLHVQIPLWPILTPYTVNEELPFNVQIPL